MSDHGPGGTADDHDEAVVGGILLAAGRSTRYGEPNKLLVAVAGEPMVRRAARSLVDSDLAGVVAILGYEAAAVGRALGDLAVETRRNEAFAEGQHTSVASGVAVARERGWDAVVFGLGDMPFVEPATVDSLLTAYREGEGDVLAPTAGEGRGNPVLFDSQYFDDLADVEGDRGGRAIVAAEGTLVAVEDSGVYRDIDRQEDLDEPVE